jgi:PIN domain nuclease of toxin-antitoxin system
MNLFLPDTHAIYWYEFGNPKLSQAAEQVFKDAQAGHALLISHPIVLAEFYWLLNKIGLQANFMPFVRFVLANPVYRYETITPDDVLRLAALDEIPEMHDRLIAAVAERLGATILTRDASLRACSKVKCLW